MGAEKNLRTPGLKWRKRAGGKKVPVWVARESAVEQGYPVKTANLQSVSHDPVLLARRCQRLQSEMRAWLSGRRKRKPVYDQTFRSLIELWQTDPESPYDGIKASSRHPYDIYAAKLVEHIGSKHVSKTDGRDLKRWFKLWAGVDNLKDPDAKIPRARMAFTVLKSAVKFGVACRREGCAELYAIMQTLEFPTNKRRKFAPTAEQVTAARKAAHAAGAPSRALAYAIQFETTLRQWDVTGQFVPLSDIRPSSILAYGMKWIGPTWDQVSKDLVLSLKHGKTEDTTGAEGDFDLKECPMVMEELQHVTDLSGPLIVNEKTGLPYRYQAYKDGWKSDFKKAGIDPRVWNRDLRAGGNTEASKAGVGVEDRAKVSGHSKVINAKVYDRDVLEAHRRTMRARREKRGNTA